MDLQITRLASDLDRLARQVTTLLPDSRGRWVAELLLSAARLLRASARHA